MRRESPSILLTGATGRVGQAVLAALQGQGVRVRAMVRSEPASTFTGAGVEPVFGDLDRPETLAPAVAGVDRLFLVTPADPHQPRRERTMIDAAVAACVERVVKLSVLGANENAPFVFGRSHGRIESHLRASGVGWTILQPNGMFHNLMTQAESIRRTGQFTGCQGNGAVSSIDVRDVGAAAAAALLGDHVDQTVVLTGGDPLTAREQATILSRAASRCITYVDLDPPALREAMIELGRPEWLADALTELHLFYESGVAGELAPGVADLTGHHPRTFATWCREHSARFGLGYAR